MRIALYQPDIPQNCGTILRLAACFDVGVDIIEPCGFIFDDRRFKRAGMDYLNSANVQRHASWEHFRASGDERRLVLATTKSSCLHHEFVFQSGDTLLMGRESSGVPDIVSDYCDHKVKIAMSEHCRSLNVAVSTGIILSEALRQTNSFPV